MFHFIISKLAEPAVYKQSRHKANNRHRNFRYVCAACLFKRRRDNNFNYYRNTPNGIDNSSYKKYFEDVTAHTQQS